MARIRGGRTMLVLPLGSPYDREVLFEYLARQVRQHESLRLRVGADECTVLAPLSSGATACSGCHRILARLAFRVAAGMVCAACVRATVVSGEDADARGVRRAG